MTKINKEDIEFMEKLNEAIKHADEWNKLPMDEKLERAFEIMNKWKFVSHPSLIPKHLRKELIELLSTEDKEDVNE